jgi:hypothetical protein
MNAINMPGFTAESSLYNNNELYKFRGSASKHTGKQRVILQLQICERIFCTSPFRCILDCREALV